MAPAYKNNTIVFASRWFRKLKSNDICILQDPRNKRLLMKRVKEVKGSRYYVVGDNPGESTDSRHFGWIGKQYIIGKIIMRL